jgi:hypothetical protein
MKTSDKIIRGEIRFTYSPKKEGETKKNLPATSS